MNVSPATDHHIEAIGPFEDSIVDTRPPSHPEEFRTVYDVRMGALHVQGTTRFTPAGVMTMGLASAAILLSLAALVRAARS